MARGVEDRNAYPLPHPLPPPLPSPLAGTGILMAVTIIYDLYEKFQKEVVEEIKANPDAQWVKALRAKAKAA